ncbi:hypothetical protein C8Q79DRAFT_1003148 [Trametes meyenii]|nr:hypothetical protein C8Q79DRAFT_1003148 [Trametes meyenii]
MADPEDVFSESLEFLYEYAPVSFASAGSAFTYHPKNAIPAISLTIPDTQAANWSLHATSLWTSAIYVADHVHDLQLPRYIEQAKSNGRGRALKLLELGAGAGLPSILISKSYENVLVTCSDYPDDALVRTLAENVKRNEVSDRCRVVPYAWGSDASALLPKDQGDDPTSGFDVVLTADTLWNSDTHRIFIETLRLTLRRSSEARVCLVAGLHTGRYVIQSFLRLVADAGFVVETLTERRVGSSEERPWSVDRAEGEDERERRRWVVWMIFKWGDC